MLILTILVVMSFINTGCTQGETEYKYWINSDSDVRHNSSCQYYGNTEHGYYTNEKVGTPCGICGG